MHSTIGDVRTTMALRLAAMQTAGPRSSSTWPPSRWSLLYAEPADTFATNAMGTVHLLEACGHVAGKGRRGGQQRQVLREPQATLGLP